MLLCKRFWPLFNGDATGSILPYSCGSLRWCYAMGAKLVVARLQLELAKCQGITPLASTCHHIFRAKQVDLWTAAAKGGDGGKTSMTHLRLLLGFLASLYEIKWRLPLQREKLGKWCTSIIVPILGLLGFQWGSTMFLSHWAIGPQGASRHHFLQRSHLCLWLLAVWHEGLNVPSWGRMWLGMDGSGRWMCVSSSSNNWRGSG